MPVFDLKNATVKFLDGTSPTPNEIEVVMGDGTISFSETFNRVYKKNRGKLYRVMNGDEEPVEVTIDGIWEYLKSDTGFAPSIEDAVKQRGEASAWVSTDSDGCSPYAIDIEIEFTPPCSDEDIETILLQDFRVEKINHNAKDATLNMTGKCNVTEATITRTPQ